MTDSIKFIFKTLIKIPLTICIVYFIANIFCFALYFFKYSGVSYAVMNTAMENNYLPPSEKATLEKTIKDIENSSVLIRDAKLIVDGTNQRKQYGAPINVGVEYKYRWLTPLMPEDIGQRASGFSENLDTIGSSGYDENRMTDAEINAKINELSDRSLRTPIRIVYDVPALRYYPDLG